MVKNRFAVRPWLHGTVSIYDFIVEIHFVGEWCLEDSFGDFFVGGFFLSLFVSFLFDLFGFGRLGECPHGKDYSVREIVG